MPASLNLKLDGVDHRLDPVAPALIIFLLAWSMRLPGEHRRTPG